MKFPNDDIKPVVSLYGLLGVAVILSVVPYGLAAVFSMIFFVALLWVAYSKRHRSAPGSFVHNHAHFMIRTIWISGLFALAGTLVAAGVMFLGLDYSGLEACTNTLAERGPEWAEQANMKDVYPVLEPCMNGFMQSNQSVILGSAALAGGPVLAYLTYRLVRGLKRAQRGEPASANPKAWF